MSVPFSQKLVLNQWLLSLFGVERFEDLAEHLTDESLEGLDEGNVHRFHHALTLHIPEDRRPELPDPLLLEYDQAIVQHTRRLNERRLLRGEDPITWKYFQYLALLFTEIYLDRYFRDPGALLQVLDEGISSYNAGVAESDRVCRLDLSAEAWPQLNKVALWSATGSGKTLIMQVNILQYRYHLERHGRSRELNRIILLTPNEGLSLQHLAEFEASGIAAELFQREGRGLFAGQVVEILDIHKLRDEMGDKTVAVESFEGNNLVLVDEGHRGASAGAAGAWLRYRNQLCERGFSFEYSATFGQAVRGNAELTDLYARSILFDYSFRYFNADGFGKDYSILNLDEATQEEHLELYLTAALLIFYQQQRLFRERREAFRPFQIEEPLWVFVGSSVTKTLAQRDATDIVEILRFLGGFMADRSASISRIGRVLSQGLVTASGHDILANRFTYLNTTGLTPAQLFDEVLATLFNSPGGGRLYVENLRGADGEIALRVGAENPPFGVINIGDQGKSRLMRLCEETGLETGEREFTDSLFQRINIEGSPINLLIGSRKFTEGWNSWRVSTLGLMNVGAREGTQIIQLFGRGVRLRGYGGSLKRSDETELPEGIERPEHIELLETLSVFGIRSDYMAQFRDFLREEGLQQKAAQIELFLPVIADPKVERLKTIRLKKSIAGVPTGSGVAFRELGPTPAVENPPEYLRQNPVVLNWYPKVQALRAPGTDQLEEVRPHQAHLEAGHIALLDIDAIYFELQQFITERGWSNLSLTRSVLTELLLDWSWYRLLIPPEVLEFDSYSKVRSWQEIATTLLKRYVDRYYHYRRNAWELPHLEYAELGLDDPNLLVRDRPGDGGYRILIDETQVEVIAKLRELKAAIESGELRPLNHRGLEALWYDAHLYQPLLYLEREVATISPVPLNKGERQFIVDLQKYHETNPEYFEARELYLLRNLSRGRGLGFFEASNFHPDFILWIVEGEQQNVIFVDPKGILNLAKDDERIEFHRTVKGIEERLGDSRVALHSFIISVTPAHAIERRWGVNREELRTKNILFQEDRDSYIGELLKLVNG